MGSGARANAGKVGIALLTLVLGAATIPGLLAQSGPPLVMKLVDPGPIGAATTTAIFGYLAVGGGYSTVFTFLNTGSTPVDGNLILKDKDGNDLNASLNAPSINSEFSAPDDRILASSIPLSIPAGGTRFITASPLSSSDPTKAGWARVESSGGTLGGVATFQYAPGGSLQTIAGVLSADLVDSATIPLDDDVPANRYTGYAVANPSNSNITVDVVTVNADGSKSATLTPVTLGPLKQAAGFVFQDKAAKQQFKGSVVLIGRGGAKFVVVALVQNQNLITAIPVIPARAPGIIP